MKGQRGSQVLPMSQGRWVLMQRWLRFLYVLFILSIPLKNVVFQVSIGLINLLFLITIFQGREAVLFLKSLRWLCLCLACLAFSMALSSILGITGMEGWREVLKHVLRFWLFLLATIYFLRQGWISRAFVGRWVLAVLFFHAVLGWIQFFWAEDFFRFIGDMDWGGRLTGVLANPNSYGFLMALAVVCSFSLVIGRRQEQGKGFLQSVFLILLFVMAFWPLLQSGSRGAWLGALAGACVAGSAVRGFWLQKSTVLLGITVAGLVAFAFRTSLIFQERVQALLAGDSSYRTEVWKDCWAYILHSPFWGYGIEAYRRMDRVYAEVAAPHNIFLSILLEMGLIGLLAYLFFFVLVLGRLFSSPENRRLRPVFLGVFTVLVVYGQFGGTMITDKIYLSFWYLLVALIWAKREDPPLIFRS